MQPASQLEYKKSLKRRHAPLPPRTWKSSIKRRWAAGLSHPSCPMTRMLSRQQHLRALFTCTRMKCRAWKRLRVGGWGLGRSNCFLPLVGRWLSRASQQQQQQQQEEEESPPLSVKRPRRRPYPQGGCSLWRRRCQRRRGNQPSSFHQDSNDTQPTTDSQQPTTDGSPRAKPPMFLGRTRQPAILAR